MRRFDIDFPVSEAWAEFYSAQGLTVDPRCIRYYERKRKKVQELDDALLQRVKALEQEVARLKNKKCNVVIEKRKKEDAQTTWKFSDSRMDTLPGRTEGLS